MALLSGAASTLMYLLVRWDTYALDPIAWAAGRPTDMPLSISYQLEQLRGHMGNLASNFLFFPTFLSIGFLGFAVNRWLSFQATEYCLQGRTQDIGLMIGGAVINPKSGSSRELTFRLYRYLNLVHMYAYGSIGKCSWFSQVSPHQLVLLGLATDEEASLLKHTPNLFRMDTVISWLCRDLQAGMRDGTLDRASKGVLFQHLSHLRMWAADLAAITSTAQPNLWTALMKILLDVLVLLFVVSSPFRFFTYDAQAVQMFVLLCTFTLVFPMVCVSTLIVWMQDPYSNKVDGFNPDGLVAFSERVIFTNMRSAFHSEEARSRFPTSVRFPSPSAGSDVAGGSCPPAGVSSRLVEAEVVGSQWPADEEGSDDIYAAQRAFVKVNEGEAAPVGAMTGRLTMREVVCR